MDTIRVLAVDRNLIFVGQIKDHIIREKWTFLVTINENAVFELLDIYPFDILLIHISLPESDFASYCQSIRETSQIPIFVIGSSDNGNEKARYLNMGSDEYIRQPVNPEELTARIKAVIRRSKPQGMPLKPSFFTDENIEIDFLNRRVTVGTRQERFTPTEYRLLYELIMNSDNICTYDYLLGSVWGDEYKFEKMYLHTYINRLRNKLEMDPGSPRYIVTIPGAGYRFNRC